MLKGRKLRLNCQLSVKRIGLLEEKNEKDKQINLTVRDDISYSEFKHLMQKVDDILGGGSSYASESLTSYGVVPLT